MTAPKYGFLKCACAIRDFVAHHYNSSVARESKRSSCATLRSNASKNASRKACGSCTSRALLSLFVASATLLATFVIAPTSALSAGSNTTVTESTVGAQSDSAKTDGEKQQSNQSESNSAELNKGDTGSSDTLKKNDGKLKSVEKQQPDSNNGVGNTQSAENAVNKTAKDDQKKDAFTEAFLTMNRSVRRAKECSTLGSCYKISYNIGSPTVDNDGKTILIKRGETRPITPEFKLKPKKTPATNLLDGLWFKLEKDGEDPVPSWVNFEKTVDDKIIKVQNTEKQTGFNGSITLRPNSKWDYGSYKFKVVIYRTKEDKKIVYISVKVGTIGENDLSLSLYDFGNSDDRVSVSNDKITIKQKSKAIANKLFIDSQSKDKLGSIYHHMICHKSGSTDYTVDTVNGLSLSTQTQFTHKEGLSRPSTGAEDSAVYESDDYTERSQSSISGTTKDDGTFECEVFAFKDAKLLHDPNGGGGKFQPDSTLVKEFDNRTKTSTGLESMFKGNIVEDKWLNKEDIKLGIDFSYQKITIQFGGKDLSLKVYPFENADGSLPAALADGSYSFSLIRGAEINPFIDAVSQSNNSKITLRMLCSKGEKKNNSTGSGTSTGGTGSSDGNSSAGSSGANTGTGSTGSSSGSQSAQSEQQQDLLEYKTWKTSITGLGVTLPSDQEPCVTDSKGNTQCTSSDNKNVAARTNIEASIKPEEVGDYKCVVYALKQNVLDSDAWKAYETSFKNNSAITNGDSLLEDINKAKLASFKQGTDYQKYMLSIRIVKFSLPDSGSFGWNMFLSVLSALVASLIAIYFVADYIKRCHSILNGRRRC